MIKRPATFQRAVAPIRALAHRFAFLFLLMAAGAIVLLGKADPRIFDRARVAVTDSLAPILDALSRPVATGAALVEEARNIVQLHEQNTALRMENARLMQWQTAARKLAVENAKLRGLLNFVPDRPARFISARVIADSGGAFVRSMLVNAGRRDGVRNGQPVVVGEGLIGRIVETGERAARILLVSDLNSRIPVTVGPDRERAVLAGDNTNQPRALYLAANAQVSAGDRVVTSGRGGVFPPGLPVGVVAAVGKAGVRVETFVASNRLEYVRIMDYALDRTLTRAGPPGAAIGAEF